MSRGINQVTLIGNVGRDPETRATQSGSFVANFSLAIGERQKRGETYEDHTEWVNCVALGKTAETVSKHVTKGSRVYVSGRLQTRKWQDKEGKDRWSTEVVVREILFLGGNKQESEAQGFDPNDDVNF